MDLKRFEPSIAKVNAEGLELRVAIRGEKKLTHVPFVYMRRVERSPYTAALSLVLNDESIADAELVNLKIEVDGKSYEVDDKQKFEISNRSYSVSSSKKGVEKKIIREGRCKVLLPEKLPISIGQVYHCLFHVRLEPVGIELYFKESFTLNRISDKKTILKTYSDI